MKDEITEFAAEAIGKTVEVGGHVASEAAECTCTGAKVVVEGAAHIVGSLASTAIRIFGPKD